MPKDFSRSERVGDAIQKELATIINNHMRDPRIGMVNVNAVDVTSDLSIAKIFVTFVAIDNEAQIQLQIKTLNNAASFLRTKIAASISLRITPKLLFIYDSSVSYGQQLSSLIDQAIQQDSNKQQE